MSLANLMSESLSYNPEGKAAFHIYGRKALMAVAREMGLTREDFNLSNNRAGIAVSGEITLHTDSLYIQLSQPCYGLHNEILYRTCEGRKDYTGGMNNFASVGEIESPEVFAEMVMKLI
jgi:hypothetical protein